MFALLRSHSKRSINHNDSVCFLMKSAPSLIRHLWHSIEHFGIAIYSGKNGTRLFFRIYVESATFNTSKDCRVGRDFEQLPVFCRQEFSERWLGWICNIYVDPCCVVEIGVGPRRATIMPFHHICVGEVAAGWCATYSTWLKAEQLDIWKKKGILKCAVIRQASQSRDFSL